MRLAVLSLLPAMISTAHGALRTWDGGGGNSFWMNAVNWTIDTGPVADDDLLFPSGAAQLANSNNFPAGTAFNSITLAGGYTLRGALVALNVGVTNLAGGNFIQLPVTLRSSVTFSARDGFLQQEGDIDTAGRSLHLEVAAPAEIQILSPISGTGGISKTGPGLLTIGANDSYFGPTDILEGTATLTHSNALGLATVGTTVSAGATIGLSGTITVAEPLVLAGRLRGSSTGTNAVWSGPVTLVNTAGVEVGLLGVPLTISGAISGSGSLTKLAPGALRLTGNNTYTGPTSNQFGTLIVDGVQRSSHVYVSLGATLKGNGTVGDVTCFQAFSGTHAVIMPGELGIGRLTTSNLFMSSATRLMLRVNGTTAGTGYGQLRVNGSVIITNSPSDISLTPGFAPAMGNSFVIIDNDGTDPVVGELLFLREGTVFNGGGYPLQITYRGGTGNDVVLTRVASITGLESIVPFPNGMSVRGTNGIGGLPYTIQAATNLSPSTQWTNIGSATADFNGRFSFFDVEAPQLAMRFYRVLSP